MADRDYGDRGGRGWNREWDDDRYGRGGSSSSRGSQGGFGEGEEFGSRSQGGYQQNRGFNRESMGARERNRGWGAGAGEDWNRGGESWQRGPSGQGMGWEGGRFEGREHPGYGYYGGGLGGEYGGSQYGGEHTRWSGGSFGREFGREEGQLEGRRGRFAGKGPKGWRRSDERIREEVNEALARNPDLDASDIEVRVENGEVTLEGVVEDRGEKRLAEDIAEDIFGVDDVNNDLKIRHGFLAGLTGEKADEREVHRSTEREPSTGRATERGTTTRGRTAGRTDLGAS